MRLFFVLIVNARCHSDVCGKIETGKENHYCIGEGGYGIIPQTNRNPLIL